MNIKTVVSLYKQSRYLKSVLRYCKKSLAPGKYVLYKGFRSLTLNDSSVTEKAKVYFSKPNFDVKKAKYAALLNKTPYFTNRCKSSSSEYDAFYTANNYDKVREIKLFSFKRSKILTICTSEKELEKQIYQFNYFKNCYNLPSVSKSDKYPNSYEISMILFKEQPDESSALKTIIDSTIKTKAINSNADSFISEKELFKEPYEDCRIIEIIGIIESNINCEVLDLDIPLCLQHGDLSKENLIYGTLDNKTDYWFIDWEHADNRVFFYDYFFYIINSAMYYNDDALISYINGNEDASLNRFFKSFGISFNPEYRKDYLLLFMLHFLKERVCNNGNYLILAKYYNFIKNILGF